MNVSAEKLKQYTLSWGVVARNGRKRIGVGSEE
jgi:hypothetical protein